MIRKDTYLNYCTIKELYSLDSFTVTKPSGWDMFNNFLGTMLKWLTFVTFAQNKFSVMLVKSSQIR